MKQILLLLSILCGIFFLWEYPILYPLKLLVVFFHESSHAIMTVTTGGEVVEMLINPQQGGHVLSRGGNRFLTLSAGYLGSLLWGITLYLLAAKSSLDKTIMRVLAIVVMAIAVLFIRDLFTLAFSLITGVIMLLLASKAHLVVNDLILRVIGLTSMLYAPLDIVSDTIIRSNLRSDAFMLADEYGGSTLMWGGLWALISIALVIVALKMSISTTSPPPSSSH
ncbi:MAG: M50 family metallopeptidase [Spongiibacteraceae bacterium]|nr:M50 family metallopeptidase [Spongiibacteraceae bacterium]